LPNNAENALDRPMSHLCSYAQATRGVSDFFTQL